MDGTFDIGEAYFYTNRGDKNENEFSDERDKKWKRKGSLPETGYRSFVLRPRF
jgi:hypothetical protein